MALSPCFNYHLLSFIIVLVKKRENVQLNPWDFSRVCPVNDSENAMARLACPLFFCPHPEKHGLLCPFTKNLHWKGLRMH
jgi:hypothetical protein